jgi:hypothetical protein
VVDLVRRRFLICDDAQAIVTRLLTAGLAAAAVPAPNPDDDASVPDPLSAGIGQVPHHW